MRHHLSAKPITYAGKSSMVTDLYALDDFGISAPLCELSGGRSGKHPTLCLILIMALPENNVAENRGTCRPLRRTGLTKLGAYVGTFSPVDLYRPVYRRGRPQSGHRRPRGPPPGVSRPSVRGCGQAKAGFVITLKVTIRPGRTTRAGAGSSLLTATPLTRTDSRAGQTTE